MKKKFHITKHDKEVLENTQKQHLGEMRFAAQVTVDGDHWSVEVVDWFEFYEPSATPYDAHRETFKQYAVVINKTLIFYVVGTVREFIERHYGKQRAEAVDYLFDQMPHRVRAGDHRSMVFVELPNDMICSLEARWTGDVLDREHVTEIRIIFERGAE